MVSACYHLLVGRSEQFFLWNSIWKQKIPSRVAFFVCTTALGEIFFFLISKNDIHTKGYSMHEEHRKNLENTRRGKQRKT